MNISMIRIVLAVLTFAACEAPRVLAQGDGEPTLEQRFEKLDDSRDHAGIVALWRRSPHQVLYVIDSYLEGSLKLCEESKSPDLKKIRAMHDRALRGAKAADEAFGRPIFSDYATAFIGWNDAQKKSFRQGQKAFGESRKALKKKDFLAALEAARRCRSLAEPLGDWWGTAMGLSSIGAAQEGLGKLEDALTARSASRMIYHDLGLAKAEYKNLLAMCSLLEKLKRYPRALRAIDHATALAKQLEDADGTEQLKQIRLRIKGKRGEILAPGATIAPAE